jgi:DNA-binding GntR family transcriptional regulator
MAGNAQLTAFLEQIQDKIRLAMATTLVTPGPSLALAEHREIYQAIQAGDPDLAQARAVRHVARLRAALAAAPAGQPGQPGQPGKTTAQPGDTTT